MRFGEYLIGDENNTIKIFHSTVDSGKRSYFEHHHTQCELSLIVSGSGIYTVDNIDFEFKKGDIFLFGSNEVHCITMIDNNETFNLLNIQFEPRILWSYNGFGNSKLLEIFYSRTNKFTNRIDRDNVNTSVIRKYIYDIENEFTLKKPEYELVIKMKLISILVNIIRNYGYVNFENKNTNYQKSFIQLEKALNYIDHNLENKITLDKLAKIACMNKTYFSTFFKKYNGISPWEYITIKRVEKAINLIKNSNLTKLEIASLCGFTSASNFYKSFLKISQKTPSDYEKDNIKKNPS